MFYSQESQPISSGFAAAGRSGGVLTAAGGFGGAAGVGAGLAVDVCDASPRISFLLSMEAFSLLDAPMDLR